MCTSTAASSPSPNFPPGFMVLHGNRLEDLRDLLIHFIQSQPLPPLVAEVILMQSKGMKHWLEMALADDAALGICAATRLELPSGHRLLKSRLPDYDYEQHMGGALYLFFRSIDQPGAGLCADCRPKP